MRRSLLAAAVMTLMVAMGAIVNAGQGNIRWTPHNMSSNNVGSQGLTQGQRHFYSTTVDQVCIFCHTPHNAQPAVPLWNKVMPTQTFKMYTTSVTLTSVAKSASQPGPESLLCLACHDGRTAVNVLHNSRVRSDTIGNDKVVDIGGDLYDFSNPNNNAFSMATISFFNPDGYGANLGKTTGASGDAYAGFNLMDDHPISFSYESAYNEKVNAGSDALKPITTPKGQGLRFFGAARDRMECSTCHDPHVDYGKDYDGNLTGSPTGNTALDPFLARDNSGSALCLACHNK